ncbi:hypothetical protein [Stenotrophomonas phage CM2]
MNMETWTLKSTCPSISADFVGKPVGFKHWPEIKNKDGVVVYNGTRHHLWRGP